MSNPTNTLKFNSHSELVAWAKENISNPAVLKAVMTPVVTPVLTLKLNADSQEEEVDTNLDFAV